MRRNLQKKIIVRSPQYSKISEEEAFGLKEHSEKPNIKTYRVIIEYLRQGIEGGRFLRGQKLPSEKELCEQFNTSRSSVREALSALEYIGLIEVRGGSGYYVSGSSPTHAVNVMEACSTKIILRVEDEWNIRALQTLFESGLDGATLILNPEEPGQWSRKVRAVRQAANDTGMLPMLMAEISETAQEKRILAAEMAVKSNMDCVIVTMGENIKSLIEIRRVLDEIEANTMLMARITKSAAHIEEALQISDGLIVDVGLLPALNPCAAVPIIMAKASQSGKILFLAGNVQETMAESGVEGQELIDKAVHKGFDGVAVITGGAARKYPVDVLNSLKKEAYQQEEKTWTGRSEKKVGHIVASPVADALCSTAVHSSQAMKALAFLVPTETGFTPRMLAKFRQPLPVFAVTPHPQIVRQLRLAWGVKPLLSRRTLRQEDRMQLAIDTAVKANCLREGDAVIGVMGNMDVPNAYNSVQLITVGDIILKGQGIGHGIVSGRVSIIKSLFDMNKRSRNKIVVVAGTDTEHIGLIEEAAGLIVEEGGLSSHAAIACMSLGKPIIIGAADATELLLEDEQITIDVMRGLVYRGWVNLG
jgi:pyruvate kinase